MACLCIGGVCIPYTAILPFLAIFLKYLAYPLVKLGIFPEHIARRLGLYVPDDANKRTTDDNNTALNSSCCPSGTTCNANDTANTEISAVTKNQDQNTINLISSYEEYQTILKSNSLVIIKFTADWCKPCKTIQPFYQYLSQQEQQKPQQQRVVFCTVDVDELDDVSSECSVAVMPTFVAFRDGVKMNSISGANEVRLQRLLKELVNA